MKRHKDKERRKLLIVPSTVVKTVKIVFECGSWRDLIGYAFWIVFSLAAAVNLIVSMELINNLERLLTDQSTEALTISIIWGVATIFLLIVNLFLIQGINLRINLFWRKVSIYIEEKLTHKAMHMKLKYFNEVETFNKFTFVSGQIERLPRVIDNSMSILNAVITMISTIAIMAFVDWRIIAVICAGAIPAAWINAKYNRREYNDNRAFVKEERRRNYLFSLLGSRWQIKDIKFGNLYDYLRGRYNHYLDFINGVNFRRGRKFMLLNSLAALINAISVGVCYFIVISLIVDGQAGIGAFVLVTGAVGGLQYSFRELLSNTAYIVTNGKFIDSYYEVLGFENEDDHVAAFESDFLRIANGGKIKAYELNPMIEGSQIVFEDVVFTYPGSAHRALDGVSVEIRPGEKVAIVGENGSGKSTFINLLLGLYDPEVGRVTYGGLDVKEHIYSVRQYISCVFQHYGQYEMSVTENVRLGDPNREISDKEIIEMCKLTGADEAISGKEEGYASHLGYMDPKPTYLSGGEWQKLIFARALIRKSSKVLILDEPTAALDPMAEAQLYENFAQITGDKTTIFISHRLGATRLADRILVFDEGRIVEQGSHEQLMKKGGLYSRMYNAQAQWYMSQTEIAN